MNPFTLGSLLITLAADGHEVRGIFWEIEFQLLPRPSAACGYSSSAFCLHQHIFSRAARNAFEPQTWIASCQNFP